VVSTREDGSLESLKRTCSYAGGVKLRVRLAEQMESDFTGKGPAIIPRSAKEIFIACKETESRRMNLISRVL
jgi:hypothetical protein